MAFENLAAKLVATRAVKLRVELKLPEGHMQARLILQTCDAKGNALERIIMSAHPDHDHAQEELLLFLVRSGYSIRHEDTYTTDLERPLTADDELSWQQRLAQAFADSPPIKVEIDQNAHLYDVVFNGQRMKLGQLNSDESNALEKWIVEQEFSKVNTVVHDFRYGEFTYYYERPEQPS
jgi:hypothetical protein